MCEASLDDLIDGWLDGSLRTVGLSFPPALEACFEADTEAARRRLMMIVGAVGYLSGVCLYTVVIDTLPDVLEWARLLYLQISMPIGLAVSASMALRLPPFLREGLTLLANTLCVCVITYLFSISRVGFVPCLVACVTMLMAHDALGIQMRFKFAAGGLLVAVLAFGMALFERADITESERYALLVLGTLTGAYLLFANWRLERDCRRSYLVTLRETLLHRELSLRDIELDELARHDPLTGLANRRAYDAWLTTLWEQERPLRGHLGLIVIDVDSFKAFNDFYGHSAGDRCLQKISLCLREQLRGTSDLIARLGGEEFAVLLPGLQASVCADVAERLRMALQRLELPHSGLGPRGLVSLSAGVASHPVLPGSSPSALYDAADAALSQAKVSGRNRVCVATILEPAVEA